MTIETTFAPLICDTLECEISHRTKIELSNKVDQILYNFNHNVVTKILNIKNKY